MKTYTTIDGAKKDINTMICASTSESFNQKWEEIKNTDIMLDWACSVHHNKKGYEQFNSPELCSFILDLQEECMNDERVKPYYETVIDEIYSSQAIAGAESTNGEMFISKALRNHNIELDERQKKMAVRTAEDYILNGYNQGLDVTDLPEFDVRFEILRNPNWSKAEKYQLLNNFYTCPENFRFFLNLWIYGLANVYDVNGNRIEWDPEDIMLYDYEELRCMFAGDNQEPTPSSDLLAQRMFMDIQFLREMSVLSAAYENGQPRLRIANN